MEKMMFLHLSLFIVARYVMKKLIKNSCIRLRDGMQYLNINSRTASIRLNANKLVQTNSRRFARNEVKYKNI